MKTKIILLLIIFGTIQLSLAQIPLPNKLVSNLHKPVNVLNIFKKNYQSVTKQALDSIYENKINSLTNDATSFKYNDAGLITEKIEYSVREDQTRKKYKELYEYDAQNKLLLFKKLNWDTDNWENSLKSIYTYDADNLLESISNFYWNNSSSSWKLKYKEDYTFSDDNLLSEIIYSNYSNSTNQLEYSEKNSFLYDSNNNLIETVIEFYDNDKWEKNEKFNYIYDADGKLLIYKILIWDDDNSQWKDNLKIIYSYNNNNQITEMLALIKNGSDWVSDQRYLFEYDSKQNLSILSWQNWINDEWVNDNKINMLYDNSYSKEQLVLPTKYNEEFLPKLSLILLFNHQLNQFMQYNWKTDHWDLTSINNYFYSTIEVNTISNEGKIIFNIYPNPAQQHINISLKEIQNAHISIYDYSGKEILSKNLMKENNSIDIHNLTKGVYLFQLKNDNKIASGKLLIK